MIMIPRKVTQLHQLLHLRRRHGIYRLLDDLHLIVRLGAKGHCTAHDACHDTGEGEDAQESDAK